MDAELAPGDQVADYRVEALHARGGMAVVYRARSLRLGRRVALKVLAGELAADERFQHRFARESELAASIEHPNIVPVYEASRADGAFFIAMRYIDGPTLREVFEQEGTLSVERTVALLAQVAGALDAAHKRGVIHRDIKPANLLMVPAGAADGTDLVYVTDFGLTRRSEPEADGGGPRPTCETPTGPTGPTGPTAAELASGGWAPRALRDRSGASGHTELTEYGSFLGTIDYVAPEQIRDEAIGPASDQYALACVAYRALTGVTPFEADTGTAVLYGHLLHEPPPVTGHRPDLPRDIDAVLAKALAKDPAERYSSCRQFVADLGGVVADAGHGLRRGGRARPLLVAGLTSAAVLGLGATLLPQIRPSAQPPPAVSLPFAVESYPEVGVRVVRTWTLTGNDGSRLTGVLRLTRAPRLPGHEVAATLTEWLPAELGPRRDVVAKPSSVQLVGSAGGTGALRYAVAEGSTTVTYRLRVPSGPVTVDRLQRWAAAQRRSATAAPGPAAPRRVSSLQITPAIMTLAVGGVPHRLKLSGRYADGSPAPDEDLEASRFTVQPAEVVSVDRAGTVTPTAAGRARVTVRLGELTASETVLVKPAPR